MTYRECDNCGASLDPGEICDCQKQEPERFFPVIRCDQPPVIFENLEDVQRNLDAILEQVKAVPKNDDGLAQVRKLRASLARDFDILETQRKNVKADIMAPYTAVDEKYKKFVSGPYKSADAQLKDWVDSYQNGMKGECEKKLRAYFAEQCQANGIDFLRFEQCGVVVDMAMARQKEPRKAMQQIEDYVSGVRQDVDDILKMEDAEAILAEYRREPNFGKSINIVLQRKLEQERMTQVVSKERQRQAQAEAHRAELVQAVPELAQEADPEETYVMAFRATGTLRALKVLKAFAQAQGITLESIKEDTDNG